MKKLVLMSIFVMMVCGTVLADVNLALPEYGGFYYVGDNNYNVATTTTDLGQVFDGSATTGYVGLSARASSPAPASVYRVWGKNVVLNRITMDTSYRPGVGYDTTGKITTAEAFYRNSAGAWVSLGTAGAGTYQATWDNLGGISTDAIKIESKLDNYCVINDIQAYGEAVTAAAMTNIASSAYISANGGTVTATGTRSGSNSGNVNDGDNSTVWSVYNSSYTNPGYWELDWGRVMKINAILVSGGLSGSSDRGANADIEIFANGSWRKVESGSAGTSGFADAFRDGSTTVGWGGQGDTKEGGEFYGTSRRFDTPIFASKIRLTNFNTSYSTPNGANYLRELVVYGAEAEPVPDDTYANWGQPYRLMWCNPGGTFLYDADWALFKDYANLVHLYISPTTDPNVFTYARQSRIKILAGVGASALYNPDTGAVDVTAFSDIYNAWGDRDGLFGYLIEETYVIPKAKQLEIYNAIKAIDPVRPVWTEFSSTSLTTWQNGFDPNACDALLSYNYPYEVGDTSDDQSHRIMYSVNAINATNNGKPVIPLIQAFRGTKWRAVPAGGIAAQFNTWNDNITSGEVQGVGIYRWRGTPYIGVPDTQYPYVWDEVKSLCLDIAGGDNLANPERYGGFYYFGDNNWNPATSVTDQAELFDGNRDNGMYGAANRTGYTPSQVYRAWGKDVTISRITVDASKKDDGTLDTTIGSVEAFYRNSGGTWTSLGSKSGSRSQTWDGLSITTDAIRIDSLIDNYAIINDITVFGTPITAAALQNIASAGIDVYGGTVTATGTRSNLPSFVNDGDNGTVWPVYNSSYTNPGYWELNWGRDMKINAILVSGGLSASSDRGANADIEIYRNGGWQKVENGSAGTSGFTDAFRDGSDTIGWGGNGGSSYDGGEFYGTSLRFDNAIVASKIRLANFNTSYSTPNGANYLRELVVYGEPSAAVNCGEVWFMGDGFDADLNKDCSVDIHDVLIMAQQWLQ